MADRVSGRPEVDEHFRGIYRESGDLYRHPASQLARFESVSRRTPCSRKRILDVGCGTGSFAEFLAGRGYYPNEYHGIDVVEDFVEGGRSRVDHGVWNRFPVKMETADYMAAPYRGYDVIVSIGVLEARFCEDPFRAADTAFEFFLKMAREAHQVAAATFSSPYADERPGPLVNVMDPAMVYSRLKGHGIKRVVIDDSYASHVYTVVVYNGQSDWQRLRNRPLPWEGEP